MAHVEPFDKEIGHGRRNDDSSSSRETSPSFGRHKKRPFLSGSDGDSSSAEDVRAADRNTPLSPGRPIIRQAVGFALTAPAPNVTTYKATLSAHPGRFLPGQAVPVPAAMKSNKKIIKKAKHEKDFSSQTTKFRVQTLDNTGVPDVLPRPAGQSLNDRATISFATFQSPPPSSMFIDYSDAYSTSTSQLGVSETPPIASSSHNTKTRPETSTLPSNLGRPPNDPSSSVLDQPRKISSYYRRNYEKGKQAEASKESNTKKSKHLVTLLIEDSRTGALDPQLAEVRLALRKASELEEGGYWGKTEELCKQLQSSPSRIDGPAKVYTKRGDYRQFFLRVSESNADTFGNENIRVREDMVVQIYVEPWITHRQQPYPTPQSLDRQHSYSSQDLESHRGSDIVSNSPSPNYSGGHRPSASPSLDGRAFYRQRNDSDTTSLTEDIAQQHSVSKFLSTATSPPQTMLHHSVPPMYHHCQPRGYESPFEDDLDNLDNLLTVAAGTLLEKQPDWKLFKSKATNRISDIILQYKFVQSMVKELVGFTPFRSSAHRIEESHILAALKPSTGGDPSVFAAVYTETLHLLQLYGKNGTRYEDPDVLKMCNDDSIPQNGDNLPKRLLRLLQQKDAAWVKDYPEDGAQVITTVIS